MSLICFALSSLQVIMSHLQSIMWSVYTLLILNTHSPFHSIIFFFFFLSLFHLMQHLFTLVYLCTPLAKMQRKRKIDTYWETFCHCDNDINTHVHTSIASQLSLVDEETYNYLLCNLLFFFLLFIVNSRLNNHTVSPSHKETLNVSSSSGHLTSPQSTDHWDTIYLPESLQVMRIPITWMTRDG